MLCFAGKISSQMPRLRKNKRDLLRKIARKTKLIDFWLGGSVVYYDVARRIGIRFSLHDYDLAIVGSGDHDTVARTRAALLAQRFKIERDKPYYLKFQKVRQIIASKGSFVVDIAIVNKLSDLGHFDWESIFWHYPSATIHDPYGALKTMVKRKLRPVVQPNDENPFLLVARFLKLCARFNISFDEDKILLRFSKKLASYIRVWRSTGQFHDAYARGHGYTGFFQAILRAKDKKVFITRLHKIGILGALFPELDRAALLKDSTMREIKRSKTVGELATQLEKVVRVSRPLELPSFRKKIRLIQWRWGTEA